MCAAITRDGVANGLLHAADSYAQVRVNHLPVAAAVANGQATFGTIVATPEPGQWYVVSGSPFGPWPLTLHSDGRPYLLRIRLAVGASSTDLGITHTYRVVLAPDDYNTAVAERDTFENHVWEAEVSASSTVSWVTGSTQGGPPSSTVLTLEASTAARWTRSVSTYDAVSAGTPVAVEQCLVSLWIFAATTSAQSLPRVYGMHAAEYVGT